MGTAQQQTVAPANLEPRMNCEALMSQSVLRLVRFVGTVVTPSGPCLMHDPHEARCGIQADSKCRVLKISFIFSEFWRRQIGGGFGCSRIVCGSRLAMRACDPIPKLQIASDFLDLLDIESGTCLQAAKPSAVAAISPDTVTAALTTPHGSA
jgi:hypothetical protein